MVGVLRLVTWNSAEAAIICITVFRASSASEAALYAASYAATSSSLPPVSSTLSSRTTSVAVDPDGAYVSAPST